MNELNVLIISHYFPPVPGVGGRRWAKFVKYLSRKQEVNVHVISAKNTVKDVNSSFEEELKSENFEHTILSSNYPRFLEFLEFKKPTLLSRVMFRVQKYQIQKKVEGNYWDFSVLWKSHFEKTIPNIIRKSNIQKVIVSGPPYRYISYVADLKKEFPDLEVILDYRDPWNNFNEPAKVSEERREYERELEREVLRKIDKVITVSEFQKSLILKNEPNACPIYVVSNGFDHEDNQFIEFQHLEKAPSDKIKLMHFGTLHALKEYYWRPFFKAFHRLKNEHPEIYKQIEIHLIGATPPQVEKLIDELEVEVNVHGILDPFVAYKKLTEADVALWFKYDGSVGDYATKFYDYVALEKFMWNFSVKGDVTEHLSANKIGQVFYREDKNLEETIYNAFLKIEDPNTRKFNPEYNSKSLQISNLTNDLIEVLNK